mgnify:CR=1 FL=1
MFPHLVIKLCKSLYHLWYICEYIDLMSLDHRIIGNEENIAPYIVIFHLLVELIYACIWWGISY